MVCSVFQFCHTSKFWGLELARNAYNLGVYQDGSWSTGASYSAKEFIRWIFQCAIAEKHVILGKIKELKVFYVCSRQNIIRGYGAFRLWSTFFAAISLLAHWRWS